MIHGNGPPATTVDAMPDPLPDDLAVLDVREPYEWVAGHAPGAVHIPLAELPGRIDLVPSGSVLVVCRSGSRSARATAFLRHQGVDAVNLADGMVGWQAASRPMVSETGTSPRVA